MKRSFYKKISGGVKIFFAFSFVLLSLFSAATTHAQTTSSTYDPSKPTSSTNYDPADTLECLKWGQSLGGLQNVTLTSGVGNEPANADQSVTTCNYTVAGNVLLAGGTLTFPNNPSSVGLKISQNQIQLATGEQSVAPTANAAGTGAATAPATKQSISDLGQCTLGNLQGFGNCAMAAVATIALAILGLMGFLLGFVGAFFNWVVVLTVFQFGSYFGNSSGLLLSWGILRDIGNIALLAAFIWFGIQIILDINSGATRKAIPMLLVVALLLNFSLFAAEAVIDVSDVLSAAMYNQAGQGAATCGTSSLAACSSTNSGIAAQVLSTAGVSTIFSSLGNVSNSVAAIGTDPSHRMVAYVGLAIFVAVTTAVLLAAALMLLIRAIVLVFILILAPLGFAAMAIPMAAGMGKKWRDLLLSQSFFAPVYLLLLLISLQVVRAVKTALLYGSPNSTLLDAISNPNTSTTAVVMVFALIIGFMIAAQMSAKSMGAIGAGWVTNAVNKSVKWAAVAPLRAGGGFTYRHTVAPVADVTGRKIASALGAGRASKFAPLRVATRIFDNAAGGAIEGGVASIKNVKVLGSKSYDEKKKADKERAVHTLHAHEEAEQMANLKRAFGMANGTPAEKLARMDAIERAVQNIPHANLEKMLGTLSAADRGEIGAVVSAGKLERLLDSKEVDEGIKEELVHAHFHSFEEAATKYKGNATKANFEALKKVARDLTGRDRKILATRLTQLFADTAEITDDASLPGGTGEGIYSDDQMKEMSQNEEYSRGQRAQINSKKKSEQMKTEMRKPPAQRNITILSNLARGMKKDIADAPADALKIDEVRDQLSDVHLAAIMAKGELGNNIGDTDRVDIINYIDAKGPGDAQYDSLAPYFKNPNHRRWWKVPENALRTIQ